jgi:CheY-like chemotaxis protein
LVEDEMLVAVMLERMLAEFGHEVIGTAADFDRALEMARRETFDLAILDVNLDGKDIYPVAEVLATRAIPFAFCTGYGQRRLPEPFRSRPTLQKPFQPRDLEQIVAEISPRRTPRSPGARRGASRDRARRNRT